MDLPAGTILASRYRVLSQIGRGGMGAVFLVEHVHTGDRAALKLLHGASATDPESIERFKREARAPAKIQSENVVRVLDADTAPEIGGAPVLVMELLTGNDLQKIVAQGGSMPPAEVVRILSQVARALDKAHAIGIVHRDLKPENLYLHQREDGTSVVKILDFGISKTMDSATATTPGGLTRTGAVMGTPLYMAPEQALGRRELIGPATDIWALGLIALFLLTGEAYWQGTTVPDILGKVLSYAVYAPTSRWPTLPPAINDWLLRSCARTPEQRFRTAGEQVAALAEILRGAAMVQVANAATMLPDGSVPTPMAAAYPPSQQPWSGYGAPNMTPPYVTPPPQTPPPMGYPYPPGVGGSTNEPFVHTARGMAPQSGAGLGVKLALAFGVVVAFLGALAATIVVVGRYMNRSDADPSATTTATAEPSDTAPAPTATQPQVEVDASLAPLHVGTATTATATVTAPRPTATATAHATATATAAQTPKSHLQCRSDCRAACVDATDMTECLTKCLRKCNAQ